ACCSLRELLDRAGAGVEYRHGEPPGVPEFGRPAGSEIETRRIACGDRADSSYRYWPPVSLPRRWARLVPLSGSHRLPCARPADIGRIWAATRAGSDPGRMSGQYFVYPPPASA